MHPSFCYLLDSAGVREPCPGEQCPFWQKGCLLSGLRPDLSQSPLLVRFLLGLRQDLEDGSRPYLDVAPGLD